MSYNKEWSTSNPGFITILIDQSGSMNKEFEKGRTKAEAAAEALNWTIDALINMNLSGEKIKDRCYLSLIGYGEEGKAKSIKFEKLSEIANSVTEYDIKYPFDDEGSPYKLGIQIKPVKTGTNTPMADAFKIAFKTIKLLIERNEKGPAPIVINISDGMPNNEQDTIDAVKRIQSLSCNDGNVLVYNVHLQTLGKENPSVRFPSTPEEIKNKEALFLFNISSNIPTQHLEIARELGLIPPGKSNDHRGCIFSANAAELIKLLAFGTSTKTNINSRAVDNFPTDNMPLREEGI